MWRAQRPLGRHIFAVGGNERAAALSGIRVNRVKLFVYMFSGFCAAIVGLIISSELMASHPATGTTFELNAIAAAVLGGTSMSGGRGTIGGTIIGAFVIGILSDGLVMMGVSEFWQMVIKGVVIIAAVVPLLLSSSTRPSGSCSNASPFSKWPNWRDTEVNPTARNSNTEKEPDGEVSGGDPMTEAHAFHLKALSPEKYATPTVSLTSPRLRLQNG